MNPDLRPADPATLPLFPPEPLVAQRSAPEASGEHQAETAHPWDWCPNCGGRLHNERCKRRCARCHYFMSCSDFD